MFSKYTLFESSALSKLFHCSQILWYYIWFDFLVLLDVWWASTCDGLGTEILAYRNTKHLKVSCWSRQKRITPQWRHSKDTRKKQMMEKHKGLHCHYNCSELYLHTHRKRKSPNILFKKKKNWWIFCQVNNFSSTETHKRLCDESL